MRLSSSCDSCSLRRVRCEATRPCRECVDHSLVCTSSRARKKRGPKGPRPSTKDRIERLQGLQSDQRGNGHHVDRIPNSTRGSSTESITGLNHAQEPIILPARPPPSDSIPLEAYGRYLDIFSDKLYPVWPVVSTSTLLTTLQLDQADSETWALAASVCAATIAQLRLVEHSNPEEACSSLQFVQEAQRLREAYDYREKFSISSVLIPFFLHIYYANVDKIRTAGVYLRESITFLQGLGLDQPHKYDVMPLEERPLRLRVFWMLFISERTYCAQNCMPTILNANRSMPPMETKGGDTEDITRAFASLTQIFAHLQGSIAAPISEDAPILDSQKIIATQADLCVDRHSRVASEVQQVDLFVTRQWIRLLIWEHTMRHFAMSSTSKDHAFSLLLPMTIAYELLSLFSSVEAVSIRAHGYGMELKLYRVADAVMDILACRPSHTPAPGIYRGIEDILYSLKNILLDIGGVKSVFLEKLQDRMAVSDLSSRPWPYLAIFGPGQMDVGVCEETGEVIDGYLDPSLTNVTEEVIEGLELQTA